MIREQAVESLKGALVGDAKGRYSFAQKKVLVSIKVRGRSTPFIFHKSDQVAFRVDAQALIVEKLGGFALKKRLFWAEVEAVSAGDPETDSGSLFQG
jgi:hypothetical protein